MADSREEVDICVIVQKYVFEGKNDAVIRRFQPAKDKMSLKVILEEIFDFVAVKIPSL